MKKLFIVLISTLSACTASVDLEAERKAILELHEKQREFHVNEQAEDFVDLMTDEFMSVNRGKIGKPTKEANLKRFEGYFGNVEFEKWDDIQPPVIRISEDGTMAYSIVNKEVIVKYQNDSSLWVRGRTEFSWLAVYKKTKSGWKVDAVASTNLPAEESVIAE